MRAAVTFSILPAILFFNLEGGIACKCFSSQGAKLYEEGSKDITKTQGSDSQAIQVCMSS